MNTITISQSKSQTSNSDNLFIGDSLDVTVTVPKIPPKKLGTLDSVQICSAGSQILIGMKLQFQTHVVFAIFNNSSGMACLQSLMKLQ